MNYDGAIRIMEFLYALKLVIVASKRLTTDDIAALEEVKKIMQKGERGKGTT